MKTLDKTERQVLVRKHMSNGLNFDEAVYKVNKFHDFLKNLRYKLRHKEKLNDNQIQERFRQEFEKICYKLEK